MLFVSVLMTIIVIYLIERYASDQLASKIFEYLSISGIGLTSVLTLIELYRYEHERFSRVKPR